VELITVDLHDEPAGRPREVHPQHAGITKPEFELFCGAGSPASANSTRAQVSGTLPDHGEARARTRAAPGA